MRMYIDVMRHGNASKVPGVDDLWRPLSPLGVEQALKARTRYADSETIPMVIHSPAPRASCTAAITVGDRRPKFVLLPSLWTYRDEPNGEGIWTAFEAYGYDVEKYIKDPDKLGSLRAMEYYGSINEIAVLTEIASARNGNERDGDVIIVVGHAVLSNFLAFHLTNDESLLKIELGEAERIRLIFEDGKYIGFER